MIDRLLLEERLHLLERRGAGLPAVVAEGGRLPLQLLEVAVAERRLPERVRLVLRPLEVLQHRALVHLRASGLAIDGPNADGSVSEPSRERGTTHQARELVVEPLDEADDVLDVHERRALHLLDQEPDEIALPLHVRLDLPSKSQLQSVSPPPAVPDHFTSTSIFLEIEVKQSETLMLLLEYDSLRRLTKLNSQ